MSSDRPLYIVPSVPVLPYATGPGVKAESLAWVEGDILVVRNGSDLPPRCVKCNSPVTGPLMTRKYWWHPPALYFLVLLHIIIYAIVAMIVRKGGTIRIGLCEKHRAKRRNSILIGTVLGLLGLVIFVIGMAVLISTNDNSPMAILIAVGPLLAIVGLIWGILGARVLRPKKIDSHFLWLAGANMDFLHGEGISAMPVAQPGPAVPPVQR